MKKNDIFKIKTPNGVEITAIVVSKIVSFSEHNSVGDEYITHFYLAYSQNRLFTCYNEVSLTYYGNEKGEIIKEMSSSKLGFQKEVCNYCVIPELDKLLENE